MILTGVTWSVSRARASSVDTDATLTNRGFVHNMREGGLLCLGKGFVPTLEIGCEVKENANSFPKQELLTHATPTALSMALLTDVRTSDARALRISTALMDGNGNVCPFGCCEGDCSRYYGCTGANCDQSSPTLAPIHLIGAIICFSITIPTIFKAAVALYKVKKAGKLNWGASTICLLYTMISAFFGTAYIADEWVYKMNTCVQS